MRADADGALWVIRNCDGFQKPEPVDLPLAPYPTPTHQLGWEVVRFSFPGEPPCGKGEGWAIADRLRDFLSHDQRSVVAIEFDEDGRPLGSSPTSNI
jgi:hypothetical protein